MSPRHSVSTNAALRAEGTEPGMLAWTLCRELEQLTELSFLDGRRKSLGDFAPDNVFVLHPYGRFCNANHVAGETDTLEAMADVQRRYRIDEDRITVRGFSMGGGATWHFAVHHADKWAAAAPGAGFSETPAFLRSYRKFSSAAATTKKAFA